MKARKAKPAAYTPRPLDTSGVKLPADLLKMSGDLAKNTHEVWARQRFAEGWKHGAERSDRLREHPCLIPYEDLPENEKEYDRNTALETLRFILCQGYKITHHSSP